MAAPISNTLSYDGSNFFRQRLVLATLSGRSVKIKRIRAKEDDPGVKDYEASFIRLLDAVTNGSRIEVNQAGTMVFYQPGMLIGGSVQHDCNIGRGIGYYLEALLMLAPFMKTPLKAVLRGVTNNINDPSIDIIKASSFPVLKRFLGTDEGLELKVNRRGSAPEGGGEVLFSCPSRQKLRPLQFTDPGKIKKIRGTAWATRVSPATCYRIVDGAKTVLNQFISDMYIFTDHLKGPQSGKSPGFGITLVAETNNGVFICSEECSKPKGDSEPSVPETIGSNAAKLLLEEIYRGGCVDSTSQSLCCLMMALGDKDVSKMKTGPLSPYTIQFLRHLRDFFQVMFKVDVEQERNEEDELTGREEILLTCVGVGFRNLSKVVM